MKKSRWGILGTADIARRQLIPSLQSSKECDLVAVASRDQQKANLYAKENNIPIAYGSYEELLGDPTIDIIYNPLPNHLHIEWSKRALEAGKHVLCEKPLALNLQELEELIQLRDEKKLLVGEAYAMLHQSRLIALHQHFASGTFGTLQSGHGCFYLTNTNQNDVRNAYPYQEGGGSLWDIGVYPVTVGRWMFQKEPVEVSCVMEIDPTLGVDYHTSGILHFPDGGQFTFSCGMRFPLHTSMSFYTESHRIEVDNTYFSNPAGKQNFTVHGSSEDEKVKTYCFEASDQYQLECENFAKAAFTKTPFSGSLEHTYENTKVLLALFKAAKSKKVERV